MLGAVDLSVSGVLKGNLGFSPFFIKFPYKLTAIRVLLNTKENRKDMCERPNYKLSEKLDFEIKDLTILVDVIIQN